MNMILINTKQPTIILNNLYKKIKDDIDNECEDIFDIMRRLWFYNMFETFNNIIKEKTYETNTQRYCTKHLH